MGAHGGYGQFWANGKNRRAHRVAFELLVGPIPEGQTLDHLCRVRACVNPAHLEPVPVRENLLRGVGVCASNVRKDTCKHGHPFTPDNTYRFGPEQRWRSCRTCRQNRRISIQ